MEGLFNFVEILSPSKFVIYFIVVLLFFPVPSILVYLSFKNNSIICISKLSSDFIIISSSKTKSKDKQKPLFK